jgi:hypothetical protein
MLGWEDVLRKEGMVEMSGGGCGGGGEERGGGRERMEGRWYITSKLVQLEADQIASRVIRTKRGAPLAKSQTRHVIIIPSLSTTLCSVTSKNATDVRGDAFGGCVTTGPGPRHRRGLAAVSLARRAPRRVSRAENQKVHPSDEKG